MSNDSAKGFIVKALKNLGYETEKIKKRPEGRFFIRLLK